MNDESMKFQYMWEVIINLLKFVNPMHYGIYKVCIVYKSDQTSKKIISYIDSMFITG